MKRAFWFYMIFFVTGIAIVAFPDNGEPVFMLSDTHGPSILDLAGITAILWPWTAMLTYAVREWRMVRQKIGGPLLAALAAITLMGFLVLAVSIRSDNEYWIAGALLAFVGQMIPIVIAFRAKKADV